MASLYFIWMGVHGEAIIEVFPELTSTQYTSAFVSAMLDTVGKVLPPEQPLNVETTLEQLSQHCALLSDVSAPITSTAFIIWSELEFFLAVRILSMHNNG